MDFGPGLDQSLLSPGQAPSNALDRVDREHCRRVLVLRVEVWPVMGSARLGEHPDHDAEESRNLWHC